MLELKANNISTSKGPLVDEFIIDVYKLCQESAAQKWWSSFLRYFVKRFLVIQSVGVSQEVYLNFHNFCG